MKKISVLSGLLLANLAAHAADSFPKHSVKDACLGALEPLGCGVASTAVGIPPVMVTCALLANPGRSFQEFTHTTESATALGLLTIAGILIAQEDIMNSIMQRSDTKEMEMEQRVAAAAREWGKLGVGLAAGYLAFRVICPDASPWTPLVCFFTGYGALSLAQRAQQPRSQG